MGWFWSDPMPSKAAISERQAIRREGSLAPPPGCPMHQGSADALKPAATPKPVSISQESACPYTPSNDSNPKEATAASSAFSKLNPLNYMFKEISQERAPSQKYDLETDREISTIPKGDGSGTWEYPSPQQMYNALLRKGYTDTDVTAVPSMVSLHNQLNELAWREILIHEGLFSNGFFRGFELSQKSQEDIAALGDKADSRLLRFKGRPQDQTPKSTIMQMLGKIMPNQFDATPPFDRHDWFVERKMGDATKEVRYVIDYYAGPDEPNGDPTFYLDVRPAVDSPILALERLARWGGDVWRRGSGLAVREANQQ